MNPDRETALLDRLPLAAPTGPTAEPPPHASSPGRHALAAGTAAATALLAACGGGESDPAPGSPNPGPAPLEPEAAPASDAQAARFLQQAQFSSSDAEIAQVRAKGYASWLDEQMALPITQTGWDWLLERGYNRDEDGFLYNRSFADHMVWRQLMTAGDAVRKRVALALSEIMVVSTTSVDSQSAAFTMAAYWDLLNRNAFGNFRQLLGEITLNPAMGMFLNMRGSRKEDSNTGRQPDENYAREVMQLFTIGLYQLNPDGTPRLGANGQPIETYGPSDVSNLARVFTGYDLDPTGYVRGTRPERYRSPMVVTTSRHSTLDASFLGTTIAGNTPPEQKLRTALDTLFNHPNTGPFIAHQLIQRLVTGAPSPAYVGRVAAAFGNNGAGARGDLAAVMRAVLLDPEARQDPSQTDPAWGKLREPMIRCVQWARSFGASSTDGAWIVSDKSDPSTGLGQSPLRSGSVFNFFRPGYVPPNTALSASGQTAPEFQITNETSVAGYLNFMQNAISNGIAGSGGSKVRVENYTAELALAGDPVALLGRLNLLLAAGQLSAATLASIGAAVATIKADSDTGRKSRVWAAILLVMASPEYIVQK